MKDEELNNMKDEIKNTNDLLVGKDDIINKLNSEITTTNKQ